jgi:hypothetical protein
MVSYKILGLRQLLNFAQNCVLTKALNTLDSNSINSVCVETAMADTAQQPTAILHAKVIILQHAVVHGPTPYIPQMLG